MPDEENGATSANSEEEYGQYQQRLSNIPFRPDEQPREVYNRLLLVQESANSILKDIERANFCDTTKNILRSIVHAISGQDFVLGTYTGQKPAELQALYNIDLCFAGCGIPREDRNTTEFINIVNMIQFQYSHECTRGMPDNSGLTERARHHISVSENTQRIQEIAAQKPRKGPLGFLNFRQKQTEQS